MVPVDPDAPLAHSPKGGIPGQRYSLHVSGVHAMAVGNAERASGFHSGNRTAFIEAVRAAALCHDIGKLDASNQAVLGVESRERLPVAHEDAGAAQLVRLGRDGSAAIVAAHHAGLFSAKAEMAKDGGCRRFRRLDELNGGGATVADHVDARLDAYVELHRLAGCGMPEWTDNARLQGCGFALRVALSCLVDADHGDTARHYGNEPAPPAAEPRWAERLEALRQYVDGLPRGASGRERQRSALRRQMFEACLGASTDPAIRACDAPVGSGKTTAVMAHLLRAACEKGLRHIIVVLPYTNIIAQAVEVYRKALVLDGERPEDIVAEHHHQADFGDPEFRHLATLWKAPIIVTTAVQFFESLGSGRPSRLRKLHELPGSAVFVDEAHAAIPLHLWPQAWRWLETWVRDWGGHIVFGSGSLPRLWELPEIKELIGGRTQVPDLVSDQRLREELKEAEGRRIRYRRRPDDARALDCDGLIRFVTERPGPRLLIVNTVRTAAVVAEAMRAKGHDVLHLSTALSPLHRSIVLSRIRSKLRSGGDWTLVATSCVESGLDFSFRVGFRERSSTASLLQTGGRVNRGGEYGECDVWDLLLEDERFSENPAMNMPRQALGRFVDDELNRLSTAELATAGMSREWTDGAGKRARELIEAERSMEYPHVDECFRVIATPTLTAIVDPELAEKVRNHQEVSKAELLRHSVHMSPGKQKAWPWMLERLFDELFVWKREYDPDFLGYMAGVLREERLLTNPGAWIV